MKELVDTKDEVVKNVEIFATTEVPVEYRRKTLKNRLHFIALRKDNKFIFSPTDFAFYKNRHDLEKRSESAGKKYKKYFTQLLGEPYEKGVSGYQKIYDGYVSYCSFQKTRPSALKETRTFWLIDCDSLHTQTLQHEPANSSRDIKVVLEDVESIKVDKTIDETTRPLLIDSRIGQGKFRDDVMKQWGNSCAFTGCKIPSVLRASHIKPWRDCSNKERLDPDNGVMLTANLDALFDEHLISFDDNGQMLFSPILSKKECEELGAKDGRLRQELNAKQCNYLAHHRKKMSDQQK